MRHRLRETCKRKGGESDAADWPRTFDRTLQETHIWLKELMDELGSDDRRRAYRTLKGMLHTLRARLTVDEAVQFGARLPMLVRGFYYEGWRPAEAPVQGRTKEDFLAYARENLADVLRDEPDLDVEHALRAVFGVISGHVTRGEVEDVFEQLPGAVRAMWPDTRVAA